MLDGVLRKLQDFLTCCYFLKVSTSDAIEVNSIGGLSQQYFHTKYLRTEWDFFCKIVEKSSGKVMKVSHFQQLLFWDI